MKGRKFKLRHIKEKFNSKISPFPKISKKALVAVIEKSIIIVNTCSDKILKQDFESKVKILGLLEVFTKINNFYCDKTLNKPYNISDYELKNLYIAIGFWIVHDDAICEINSEFKTRIGIEITKGKQENN